VSSDERPRPSNNHTHTQNNRNTRPEEDIGFTNRDRFKKIFNFIYINSHYTF